MLLSLLILIIFYDRKFTIIPQEGDSLPPYLAIHRKFLPFRAIIWYSPYLTLTFGLRICFKVCVLKSLIPSSHPFKKVRRTPKSNYL